MESYQKPIAEKTKWLKLRPRLSYSYNYSEDWEKAIVLLEGRLRNKYIYPINKLVDLNIRSGEGFPMMASCCSLIETIAAFQSGKVYNHNYQKGIDPNYQFNDSIGLFCDFLKNTTPFASYFDTADFIALDFYSCVRSSLVHECRTKNNWIIRNRKSKNSSTILEKIGNDKIIYRTTFFNAISKVVLPGYYNDLRIDANKNLRRFLGRKMDSLYEFKRDQKKFDWWKED